MLYHANSYYPASGCDSHYTSSFMVPLFFMLSGCFYKPYDSTKTFLKKKVNTLIIPFLFFYLVFSVAVPNLLHACGYAGIRQTSALGWSSLFNCFTRKIYSNTPVWFLLALFWVTITFYGIQRITNGRKHQHTLIAIATCAIGLLGYTIGNLGIFLPLNIDNAMTAFPFYTIGYYAYRHTTLFKREYSSVSMLLCLCVCVAFVTVMTPGCDFLANHFPWHHIFGFYGCALLGSLGILIISKCISTNKMLSFYGKNTLILLCMQMSVLQVTNIIVSKCYHGTPYVGIALLTIGAAVIMIPVIYFLNRYLPFFCGKKIFQYRPADREIQHNGRCRLSK